MDQNSLFRGEMPVLPVGRFKLSVIEIPLGASMRPAHKRISSRTRIILENYEVQMFLGLHDFEKETTQRVLISVCVDLRSEDQFWDYDHLVKFIESEISGSSIETQEELCDKLITFVETTSDPIRIQVQSKKPDIFKKAEFVSIQREICYD